MKRVREFLLVVFLPIIVVSVVTIITSKLSIAEISLLAVSRENGFFSIFVGSLIHLELSHFLGNISVMLICLIME